MANFTETVKTICETMTGKQKPSEVIIAAAPLFFDFDFPFYDESKRTEFEINFLRHFYMREIGLETQAYFFLRLEDKLNLIMPYYNKLLTANAIEYDPFYNEIVNEKITRERTGKSTGSDTTNTENNSTTSSNTNSTTTASADDNNQNSELPQGSLSNFNDNSYLSSAGKGHSESSSSVTGKDEATVTGTGNTSMTRNESTEGNETESRTANNTRGDKSGMLRAYYEAQHNIFNDIFNDCEELFIQLWV